MRTTIRIDDELLADLKREAHERDVSLSKLVNRMLRRGLEATAEAPKRRPAHREAVHSMGRPKVDLTKALAVADALEEAAVADEMALRR